MIYKDAQILFELGIRHKVSMQSGVQNLSNTQTIPPPSPLEFESKLNWPKAKALRHSLPPMSRPTRTGSEPVRVLA